MIQNYLNETTIELVELLEMVHEGSPFLDKRYLSGWRKFINPLKYSMVKNARSAYAKELLSLKRKKQYSDEMLNIQRQMGRTPSQRSIKNNILNKENLEAVRSVPDTYIGTGFSTRAARATYQRSLANQSGNQSGNYVTQPALV
jgi:hypothetical protein